MVKPLVPIQGRLLTSISSGTAMVSKGMIRVATMADRITFRHFHSRNTKENAAREQRKSDRSTVTPVTNTELNTKRPTGARLKAAE